MSLLIWGVVFVAIVLLIFLYVKFRYVLHKFHWIIIILGVVLLYLTFMFSISGADLNLLDMKDLRIAGDLYWVWMGNAFENTKTLTANVIKMDWGIPNPFG